jgi:TP901 family phage tail tape measure protein
LPHTGAAKALKQLGVSVSDASGKMRPVETILSTSTRQLKNTDKLIRLDSLKTLLGKRLLLAANTAGAGSGELQKLVRELKGRR